MWSSSSTSTAMTWSWLAPPRFPRPNPAEGATSRDLSHALTVRTAVLTATVTATAAANGKQRRSLTALPTCTIRRNWGYVRPEKRKVVRQRRTTEDLAYASVRFRYLAGGGLLGRAEGRRTRQGFSSLPGDELSPAH